MAPATQAAAGGEYVEPVEREVPCYSHPVAKPKKRSGKTKPVSEAEAKRRHDVMDEAILSFEGQLDELEGALGMYMLGRHVGWKVLYIVHSKKTVAKYETILKIDVREEFEEETSDSLRSMGYRLAKAFTNFWKVVSGEEKIDRAERKLIDS